ncbi:MULTISPECIES: ABC transporter ATP-binding protein [Streptococcaceae]|uniref:Putative Na(+) ABC exporter, ATP-binding subunit n=1 Tax=Pseudolactococcus piscium MKFS47 TaxID=297352 RepID=A0A0D6DVR9_9LACT|nr:MULTISPECIES: ABC transporter ATP-binding protein [Lactococcus]MCJ1971298.1 ABC transporter ATP-binding protein [Lactococcus carnosus]MDN5402926.1 ABC transporter ATP-binding protein [Lactococcus sp.]MDN5408848.1 ABC transporter ATP-binding protein [Lactococcus sp.]MDN5435988.1 ABC transporter ATP-binding protein [Lactococcus sp.]MDN5460835.1 ABC transporter ATP-binding protein [Lactococcus sp.]
MLRIERITKQFGDKIAVDSLDMTVEDGSIMGLIGQNGAGKTTTFRMILDFIKSDSGLITWNGKPITQDVKQGIGFLPEERGLYQKMTVEEQILYFAELHGMKRDEARKELVTWMDKLEVVGKITDKVQTLSKGNAQKVQFIATLIHRPNFLILDEPFTGLDPVNTSLLMNEIKTLKENGAAIIFSSHNMSGVELLSDNLTMLKKGKVVLQGDIYGIRNSFGRTQVYVESELADTALSAIAGVKTIEKQGAGRLIHIADEAVGHDIFKKVSETGYVQAFVQAPPTLDEIFRKEVAEHV